MAVQSAPRWLPAQVWTPQHVQRPADVFTTWLRTWSYAATAASTRRDLRIDLLRGFCVLAMIADHLGGESWLYAITGGNHSFISAAEGFVFISGLVMGQAYESKIQRLGLKSAIAKALLRARTLYVITVVLTLIFSIMRLYTDMALWLPRTVSPGAQSFPHLSLGPLPLNPTYH